jgi:hypothetical protein
MLKKLYKIVVFLMITEIVIPNHSQSQHISFFAKGNLTGSAINLDSVKVINRTQNRDTILRNDFSLDLSIFTDIATNELQNFSFKIINSENINEINALINIPTDGELNLRFSNILGEQFITYNKYFNRGTYNINLPEFGFSDGVYLISANLNNIRNYYKILKTGNSYITSTSKNHDENNSSSITNLINVNDIYDFIGYANYNQTDTIRNQIPTDGFNYIFQIIELSRWKFNSIVIHISGFEARYFNTLWQDWGMYDIDTTWYDTRKIDTNYIIITNPDSISLEPCTSTDNGPFIFGDTVNYFTCRRIPTYGSNWPEFNIIKFNLIIDTLNMEIRGINYKFEYIKNSPWSSLPYIDATETFNIDKIPFKIQGDGKIYGELLGDVAKSMLNKFKYNYKLEEWYRTPNQISSRTLDSTYNFSNDMKISISFNP